MLLNEARQEGRGRGRKGGGEGSLGCLFCPSYHDRPGPQNLNEGDINERTSQSLTNRLTCTLRDNFIPLSVLQGPLTETFPMIWGPEITSLFPILCEMHLFYACHSLCLWQLLRSDGCLCMTREEQKSKGRGTVGNSRQQD